MTKERSELSETAENIVRTTVRMPQSLHQKLVDRVTELGRGLPPKRKPSIDAVIQASILKTLDQVAGTLHKDMGSTIVPADSKNEFFEIESQLPSEWLRHKDDIQRLLYILERGHPGIGEAIKNNLEWFHMTARILNGEADAGGVSKILPGGPSTGGVERAREIEQRHFGGGMYTGTAQERARAAKKKNR